MTDLSWFDHFLLATAGAVITAVVPIVAVYATRTLHLTAGSALSTDLDNAIAAGSRLVLDELSSVAAHNITVDIKNTAVAKAVAYVQTAAPAALKAIGVAPTTIAAMIAGEVSKVLDMDAGVTAPVAVTAPSIPVMTMGQTSVAGAAS